MKIKLKTEYKSIWKNLLSILMKTDFFIDSFLKIDFLKINCFN